MATKQISSGTVHKTPSDLKKALTSVKAVLEVWEDITPLARNEWICWVTSAKKDETRKHRIEVGIDKMKKGMRRPCCWIGCIHRADKSISPSQKYILGKTSKKKNTIKTR